MRSVAALIGGLALAGSSFASATLTFQDPGFGAEFFYDSDTNELEFERQTVFEVDGSPDITPATFDAMFTFTGLVGGATIVPVPGFGDFIAASVSATFAWVDVNTNEVILSGSFETGVLSNTTAGFNLTADATSGLTYTIGSALDAAGYAGLEFVPIDGNWTLTGFTFDGGDVSIDLGEGEGDEFASFEANSAFSGTVTVVPTPGSIALIGLAAVGVASTRRR